MKGKFLLASSLLLPVLTIPARADRQDQYSKNYGFKVVIDGVDQGQFLSIDGLGIEQEVVEYRDGTDLLVRKLPGRLKYRNIKLKRRYAAGSRLNDWIQAATLGGEGNVRKDISITLLDRAGNDLHTFNYSECFLTSWKLSPLDTGPNAPLTEEIVATCDFFVEP